MHLIRFRNWHWDTEIWLSVALNEVKQRFWITDKENPNYVYQIPRRENEKQKGQEKKKKQKKEKTPCRLSRFLFRRGFRLPGFQNVPPYV